VAALGAGTWLWLHRPAAAPLGPADAARKHVGILTEALVTSQVELARTDMENRDYEAAKEHAGRARELDRENADAKEVLARAQRSLKDRDAAVEEARTAFRARDYGAATEALGRVMSLDPRNPVVAELSSQLNERFNQEAQKARGEAQQAHRAADGLHAARFEGYGDGARLEKDAAALLGQGKYTGAAQKYIEARDAFERSRRLAEDARSTPPPVASAPAPSAARVATVATPEMAVPTVAPQTPPSAPPARPGPPATTLAAAPAPTAVPAAAASAAPSGNAAVLQLVHDYERALESRDFDLYRAMMPKMSSDDEKIARESFKEIKSYKVDLANVQVAIDGSRATVSATRQDTVEGHRMKQREQIFHLVLRSGTWHIESLESND
jgi:tetratricopeptide (TPR) repeat protein